jgi:hypothetical protein
MDQHADEDDHGILTGAEHQLLHAADHGQPLPASMSATLQVWALATILIFSYWLPVFRSRYFLRHSGPLDVRRSNSFAIFCVSNPGDLE